MNFFKNNYQIKSNFFKKAFIVFFIILIVTIPAFVFAQVTINPNLPGAKIQTSNNNPCTSIINFYWFAIFISGILAFGAIVYGGIKYQLAAGNPSGESEGKKWIMGAIEGLLLLFSAYLILKIINPNLTKCQLPELSPAKNEQITLPNSASEIPVLQKVSPPQQGLPSTSEDQKCTAAGGSWVLPGSILGANKIIATEIKNGTKMICVVLGNK
jgi:hypothetical protein